jgi:hypothetical protein
MNDIRSDLRRWIKICEGKIERMPYTDYMGNEFDLILVYDPTPQQARNLIDRSEHKRLRVLVVGQNIVCWDAYYVEHVDIAKMLGHTGHGRDGKLWLMFDNDHDQLPAPVYRLGGGSWQGQREQYIRIPAIARLLAAGFAEPQS